MAPAGPFHVRQVVANWEVSGEANGLHWEWRFDNAATAYSVSAVLNEIAATPSVKEYAVRG